jgi:hypothetical protein
MYFVFLEKTMDVSELRTLKRLMDEVIYSPTKADAKLPLSRLESKIRSVQAGMDPYLYGKLREVANYVKQASGRVGNKEHWAEQARASWYVFESGIEQD